MTPDSANLPTALSGMGEHGDFQDFAPRVFDKYPGILYVHQQNLPGLYRILCHQVSCCLILPNSETNGKNVLFS